MEVDFQSLRLGDCVERVVDNRGKTPPWHDQKTPYELIEVNALKGASKAPIYSEIKKYVDKGTFDTWFRAGHPSVGDVLISTVGSIGEVALAENRGCIAQNVVALRTDRNTLLGEYLYYYLLNPVVKQKLLNLNISSVQPSIKVPHLLDLKISFPSWSMQKAIVRILCSLDDKIELNRQTNQTLEAMAQALFKSWFVDFDPVIDNALSAGNEIPEPLKARAAARQALGDARKRLPEEIRREFPDGFEFVDELGWVPRGWEATVLKELTTKIGSGATPRGGSKVYQSDGTSLIRSQNVYDSRFVWEGLARISDEAALALKGVTVEKGDVLLNITGASILRTCVVDANVLPARVNQHVAIIRSKDSIPSRFLHLHMQQEKTKKYLLGLNAGGSREAVTKGHIESVPIVRPTAIVLNSFHDLCTPMYGKVSVLATEARSLESIRDTLLPKLLSGQLTIPDAEKLVYNAL